jgi:hypothetical protein
LVVSLTVLCVVFAVYVISEMFRKMWR